MKKSHYAALIIAFSAACALLFLEIVDIDANGRRDLRLFFEALRTPLNPIIGFTGILLQGLGGPVNEEQTKQLSMVRTSANHLLSLISDVLDISKIEAGQLTVASEPFSLRESILKVLQSVRPLVEKKRLDLSVAVAEDVQTHAGWSRCSSRFTRSTPA